MHRLLEIYSYAQFVGNAHRMGAMKSVQAMQNMQANEGNGNRIDYKNFAGNA
jgi:hypothetical protein